MSIDPRLVAFVLAVSLLTPGSARGQEPASREAHHPGRRDRGGRSAGQGPPAPAREVERIRGPQFHAEGRGRRPLRGRLVRPGRGEQGAIRASAGGEGPRRPLRLQGALLPQVEAGDHLFPRAHVRRPHRRVPGAGDRDHGGGARAVGAFLRRPHQGRVLPEQGHGRLLGLDDRSAPRSATPRSRSWPTASSGSAICPSSASCGTSASTRTCCPRGRASRPTTPSSSAAWPGSPSCPRRRARFSTSG